MVPKDCRTSALVGPSRSVLPQQTLHLMRVHGHLRPTAEEHNTQPGEVTHTHHGVDRTRPRTGVSIAGVRLSYRQGGGDPGTVIVMFTYSCRSGVPSAKGEC